MGLNTETENETHVLFDFFSFKSIFLNKCNNYMKKLSNMFSMILAASLIILDRDRLLMETDSSNSVLISKTEVPYFSFLLSHINPKPAASIQAEGKRKGSTASSSSLSAFSSVKFLS